MWVDLRVQAVPCHHEVSGAGVARANIPNLEILDPLSGRDPLWEMDPLPGLTCMFRLRTQPGALSLDELATLIFFSSPSVIDVDLHRYRDGIMSIMSALRIYTVQMTDQ